MTPYLWIIMITATLPPPIVHCPLPSNPPLHQMLYTGWPSFLRRSDGKVHDTSPQKRDCVECEQQGLRVSVPRPFAPTLAGKSAASHRNRAVWCD